METPISLPANIVGMPSSRFLLLLHSTISSVEEDGVLLVYTGLYGWRLYYGKFGSFTGYLTTENMKVTTTIREERVQVTVKVSTFPVIEVSSRYTVLLSFAVKNRMEPSNSFSSEFLREIHEEVCTYTAASSNRASLGGVHVLVGMEGSMKHFKSYSPKNENDKDKTIGDIAADLPVEIHEKYGAYPQHFAVVVTLSRSEVDLFSNRVIQPVKILFHSESSTIFSFEQEEETVASAAERFLAEDVFSETGLDYKFFQVTKEHENEEAEEGFGYGKLYFTYQALLKSELFRNYAKLLGLPSEIGPVTHHIPVKQGYFKTNMHKGYNQSSYSVRDGVLLDTLFYTEAFEQPREEEEETKRVSLEKKF